ncbi:hypothetical protein KFE25_002384 [Diacronema lutheri]|uniref:Uncharacterized protein n=1 Tax=Diacronema lutheri TaxID=2081491 RepID=A0A8J6C945_DIALT|nr:hypothetical protein KFE25_002384 [Diacronema lutheri]
MAHDIFEFLMIDEPRDRIFLAGGDFFSRGGEVLPDESGDADEDAAPVAADEEDAPWGVSDAELQHNPFPRAPVAAPPSANGRMTPAGS